MRNQSARAAAIFRALTGSPIVRELIESLHQVTGWEIQLQPSRLCSQLPPIEFGENSFCKVVSKTKGDHLAICRQCSWLLDQTDGKNGVTQVECFAGLTQIGAPIRVNGLHVATLIGGKPRVKSKKASLSRKLDVAVAKAARTSKSGHLKRAWSHLPARSHADIRAMSQILVIQARFLAAHAAELEVSTSASDTGLVARGKRLVHQSPTKPPRMAEVARRLSVSPQYFCRLFRKTTGLSFVEYCTHLRIQKAKGLLQQPGILVKQVAMECGFTSMAYFDRVFHKSVGFSPHEYQANIVQPKVKKVQTK